MCFFKGSIYLAAMKKRVFYIIVFIACIISSARAQQTMFNLRVDSLPSLHRSYYLTDPNQTGHLTHKDDTVTDVFNKTFGANFFNEYASRNGDTVVFRTKEFTYPSKYLEMVLDTIPLYIKSMKYSEIVFNVGDHVETYYLKIDNIQLQETGFAFECIIDGAQILEHSVRDSNYNYVSIISGNQSWTDIYEFADSVTSASRIYFLIGKSSLLSTHPSPTQENENLHVYPNPTTGTLFVSLPEQRGSEVVFMDVLGRTLFSLPARETGTLQLDLSSLTSGIYWLRVGSEMQKIIIQR